MKTITQYVFRVRYANDAERNIQSCVPFAKWQLEPGFAMRRKAVLLSKERKIEVECIPPPKGCKI